MTSAVFDQAESICFRLKELHRVAPGRPEIPMYSYGRPSTEFWHYFVIALLEQGKSEEEVIAILQHRDVRKVLDGSEHKFEALARDVASEFA